MASSDPEKPRPINSEIYTPNWQHFGRSLNGDYRIQHIVLHKGLPATFEIDATYVNRLIESLALPGVVVLARQTTEAEDPSEYLPKSGKFSDSIGNPSSSASSLTMTNAPENPRKKRLARVFFGNNDDANRRHLIKLDFEEIRRKAAAENHGKNANLLQTKYLQQEITTGILDIALKESGNIAFYQGYWLYLLVSQVFNTVQLRMDVIDPEYIANPDKLQSELVSYAISWVTYGLISILYSMRVQRKKKDIMDEVKHLENPFSIVTEQKSAKEAAKAVLSIFIPPLLIDWLMRLQAAPMAKLSHYPFVRPATTSIWALQADQMQNQEDGSADK